MAIAGKAGAAGGVGVLVGVDVEPARLRGFDQFQRLGNLAPVLAARRFVVRDLDGNARPLADLDGLADRIEQPVALVAHVGCIQAARAGHFAGEFDDLVRLRPATRLVDEPGRQADEAGIEAFVERVLHRPHLVAGGFAPRAAHRCQPQRAVADEGGDVDRRRSALEQVEVARVALPGR